MTIKHIVNGLAAMILAYATAALGSDRHCVDGVGDDRARTPDNVFVDLGDGSVRHQDSGLQWMRCALGQTYDDQRCAGQANVYSWADARTEVEQVNRSGQFGNYSDWRLPSVDELKTIIEGCRQAPAINTTIFPDTPASGFWTRTYRDRDDSGRDLYQTEHVDSSAPMGAVVDDGEDQQQLDIRPEEAWFVGFYQGIEFPYNIDSSYRVRLVRGGPQSSDSDMTALQPTAQRLQ
ncbi:MAG: DUF1566 domain-containing protein [Wenzhouxiangellaceae bacterium]